MGTRSVTYEVGITLCSGSSFSRNHTSLEEAMDEYSTMLSCAIDPSLLTQLNPKHIRMVTLIGRDELGNITHHINSPVFGCEDRAVA